MCGVNLHRGFESPPLRQFFRARKSLQGPFVERYPGIVKKRSAVSELVDMLAKGLAKVSPEERKRVIKAGDALVATRRALLSKPRSL